MCLEWGADCLHMVQLMALPSQTPSSLASFKSRLVLPFWYRLTQVVLVKRPLNGCSSSVVVRWDFLSMYHIWSLWVHPLWSCEWRCKIRKWGGLGQLAPQCHHSIERIQLNIRLNRNHASILYRFRDIAGYLSKVADFYHPTCIWRPRRGWPR